jgi:DNA (cytosine-5)-methyltransferase 1
MMKTGHLFAGGGGGLLADLILGHDPVFAVEWDKNCCRTLRNRAADGWFPGLRVYEGDIRLFDPSPWKGRVDCLAAGFPCQDISAAGTGKGITGARSGLVSEVFRAVDIIAPPFVFLENSPRIRTRGRHVVIAELISRGYAWRDGILAASDVGAWHDRERWWLLAANAGGLRKLEQKGSLADEWRWIDNGAEEDADTDLQGRPDDCRITTAEKGTHKRGSADVAPGKTFAAGKATWFEVEPDVGRLVYGMATELVPGAVKALGNGQVPLQAAAAFALLSCPGGP